MKLGRQLRIKKNLQKQPKNLIKKKAKKINLIIRKRVVKPKKKMKIKNLLIIKRKQLKKNKKKTIKKIRIGKREIKKKRKVVKKKLKWLPIVLRRLRKLIKIYIITLQNYIVKISVNKKVQKIVKEKQLVII